MRGSGGVTCSLWHCLAVSSSVWQYVAVCGDVWQCMAVHPPMHDIASLLHIIHGRVAQ